MEPLGKLLENVSAKHSGEFSSAEGKWFNSNGYLPLYEYAIRIPRPGLVIKIHYEHKANEFTTPGGMDMGVLSDRHTCKINCVFSKPEGMIPFHIQAKSRVANIFSPGLFRLKCKDAAFKNRLKKNASIREIYELSRKLPDFKPMMEGKLRGEVFHVEIHYGTNRVMPEVLEKFIHVSEALR
jgi:hypothetical protein